MHFFLAFLDQEVIQQDPSMFKTGEKKTILSTGKYQSIFWFKLALLDAAMSGLYNLLKQSFSTLGSVCPEVMSGHTGLGAGWWRRVEPGEIEEGESLQIT